MGVRVLPLGPLLRLADVLVLLAHRASRRSGCLRTNRAIPRACQSVCRERKLPVDDRRVVVDDDRARDVPPLPARLHRPVAEVDVLAVVPEPRVPAADLLEHRAALKQERAEQPVGLHGLRRALVEEVVVALLVGAAEAAERCAANDRPAHGRKEAPRRLPGAVRPAGLRARDAAARMRIRELDERGHRAGFRNGIGIRDEHVLPRGRRDPRVHVRRERQRARILEQPDASGQLLGRAGEVRDHERLVDLGDERGQRALELGRVAVRDDDGRHLHSPSTSR